MAAPTDTFVSHFNSLTGETIAERRKNLFLLLNKIQPLSGSQIDFSSVHPGTPLEETLKVDALIHFQRVPELVEVLKSENPVLIKKVLRVSSWFWEQAFRNEEESVALIFPRVSFNVKVKIVNKLSMCLNDAKKADRLFEAIRGRCGSYLAFKLLPACSEKLILQIMTDFRAKLSARQLLFIVKEYPDLAKPIFSVLGSNMNKNSIAVTYKNVFIYLAETNNASFLDLCDEYHPPLRLGRRATHKFISRRKETVIKDSPKLHWFLHKKQSAKSLKQDFAKFYSKLFPSSVEEFPNSFVFLYSFVRNFRSDEQKLNMLEEIFRKMYGSELLDHPRCVTLFLLELLPPSKRENISFKPLYISEDRWSCYSKIDNSIPYLKKRISQSSEVRAREDLIVNLVETCRINRDTKALAEVCKYVVKQHRNDLFTVRKAFLTAVKRSFELQNLDEEHWVSIKELLEIFEINNETYNYTDDFLVAFIHYRLLKGLDIKESLVGYLKLKNDKWNLLKSYPHFEKRCLLMIEELLPQIYNGDTLKLHHVNFLNCLIYWNERHREDEISLFDYPDAVNSFRRILPKIGNACRGQNIIEYFLRSKYTSSELLTFCLSKFDLHSGSSKIFNWLMQCKPLTVNGNVEIVSKLILQRYNRFFWRQCRNYTHLEMPQKFGDACLKALHEEVPPNYRTDLIKRNAIGGLSYLLKPDKFLEFASNYVPEELRADALRCEDKKRYKLQRSVAGCLKNVIPPSLALESILNFCKGDYLKLIHSSLYSVSGNVSEDKLPPFLSELANRAVSARKHTFHLTLRVLDRSLVFEVFNRFMETEKNPSIRKFLFKGSFNLFLQDSDDYLWELVKSNLQSVDVDDREVVQILMEVDRIPSKYVVEYVLFIWNYLEKLPDPDGVKEAQKFGLLQALPVWVVQALPKLFCSAIIQNYFKSGRGKESAGNINSFICKFVIYCDYKFEQEERMNEILPHLKRVLFEDRRNNLPGNFIRQFCSEFLEQKCLSKEILLAFAALWNSHIGPHEAFNQYLYLQFCLIYIDSIIDVLNPTQIGEKLARVCDSLSDSYGTAVVTVISDVLRSFFRYFFEGLDIDNERSRYLLIEGMIKASTSKACLLTAISLLKRNVEYSEVQLKHDEVVKFFNGLGDPLIQIHLNHHLYR